MSSVVIDRKNGTVSEPARAIPIAAEVDVVVAGGGPAGFAAALAAARTGAKTLLVEKHGVLGGASTAVLMNAWNCPADHMSGISREAADRLIEQKAATAGTVVNFDPEALIEIELDALMKAGVRILLYAWVVEPIMDGNCIRGVILQSKSGRQAVLAKAVVDATGDGDVAYLAGAPSVKGREKDGKMRPVSTLFRVAGVDMAALVEYCRRNPDQFQKDFSHHIVDAASPVIRIAGYFDLVEAGRKRGEIPDEVYYLRFEGTDPKRGVMTVNSARVYDVDGTDMWDVTRGDLESRRQNRQLYQFIKNHVPGCQDCYVISSSSLLGVRETRRILGEHLLIDDDLDAGKTYVSSIAKAWRYIVKGYEGHSPDGKEGAPGDFEHRGLNRSIRWFEIPYGVVVPQKVDGLTVGGRIVSQNHKADMWTRGQYCCMMTGQAAGTAAALAALSNALPRNLDVAELQRALIKQGVDIGEAGKRLQIPSATVPTTVTA